MTELFSWDSVPESQNFIHFSGISWRLEFDRILGKVSTADAFLYLFRRYGLPNAPSDDFKDLCCYTFNTPDPEIMIQWRLGYTDRHFHLVPFSEGKLTFDADTEYRKPMTEWWNKLEKWQKEEHNFVDYDHFSICLMKGKKKKALIDEMIREMNLYCEQKGYTEEQQKEFQASKENWEKFEKEFYREYKQPLNKKYEEEFEAILPKPAFHFENYRLPDEEAMTKQYEYLCSLPENSAIKRIWKAFAQAIEDWKLPTYVRDHNFNIAGEETETNIFPLTENEDYKEGEDDEDEKFIRDGCGASSQAGYSFSRLADMLVKDEQKYTKFYQYFSKNGLDKLLALIPEENDLNKNEGENKL